MGHLAREPLVPLLVPRDVQPLDGAKLAARYERLAEARRDCLPRGVAAGDRIRARAGDQPDPHAGSLTSRATSRRRASALFAHRFECGLRARFFVTHRERFDACPPWPDA